MFTDPSLCITRETSQRSLHNAPIFRLLLKVAVNGTHQCDFLNFWGAAKLQQYADGCSRVAQWLTAAWSRTSQRKGPYHCAPYRIRCKVNNFICTQQPVIGKTVHHWKMEGGRSRSRVGGKTQYWRLYFLQHAWQLLLLVSTSFWEIKRALHCCSAWSYSSCLCLW